MSKRSILTLSAVVVLVVLTALARDRGGIDVRPAAGETVEIAGDTIPTGGVPAAVVSLMEQGRAWRAARAMRETLSRAASPNPESVLFAAIAEAEWGGWTDAREYLEGKPWLDEVAGGLGWYWLGRAREATDDLAGSVEAYDRFLDLASGSADSAHLATAELRRGLLLLRQGRRPEGAEGLLGVRERAPYLEDWMNLLAAEALAESGDTAAG